MELERRGGFGESDGIDAAHDVLLYKLGTYAIDPRFGKL